VRGVGVSLKWARFVLNGIKWASKNSVNANFSELRHGEVQHSPGPEDTGSPTG
jgi:hypothetical protein